MSATERILNNVGISEYALRKLHRYDLLDTLQDIPGIGVRRLQHVRHELDQLYENEVLPPKFTWQYRLALDLLKIPLKPTKLCLPEYGQKAVIDRFVSLDGHLAARFNDWLSRALFSLEQSVVVLQYRDHLDQSQIAKKLGITTNQVSRTKNQAFRRLRNPQELQRMRDIILSKNTSNAP